MSEQVTQVVAMVDDLVNLVAIHGFAYPPAYEARERLIARLNEQLPDDDELTAAMVAEVRKNPAWFKHQTERLPITIVAREIDFNYGGKPDANTHRDEPAAVIRHTIHAGSDPYVRIAQLEAELVREAQRTASEKLRADQMTSQHRMQAAMAAEARGND